MNIYLLIDLPIIGELGDLTETTLKLLCDSCGKKKRVYKTIDYRFDCWNGEDLISAYNLYFISERLKNEFIEKGIIGIQLIEIKTSMSDDFYYGKKAYLPEIPKFYYMEVTGRADGEKQWWEETSTCDVCKRKKWKPTKLGIRASLPSVLKSGEDKELFRNVYKDSNNNADIFLFDDPVKTPFVTQRVVDIFDDFKIQGLELKSVEWIEKSK